MRILALGDVVGQVAIEYLADKTPPKFAALLLPMQRLCLAQALT